jgi:hypothetical protein
MAITRVRADPEKQRLRTPSGKIELYSERIASFGYDDFPPHPTWRNLGGRCGTRLQRARCLLSRPVG